MDGVRVGQSPSPYTYDQAGDVSTDMTTFNQYLYDGEGRICASASPTVDGFTVMTGYVYDAEGTRVAKGTITQFTCDLNPADSTYNGLMTANNETDYVLGPGGEQVTELAQDANGTMNWQRTYVYADGALIATYDPNPDNQTQPLLSYRLTDWLGTLRATTDSYGVAQGTCTGLPFGDGVTCNGDIPDNHHFTGKERDQESGNDYFGARYYASSMGRFMSPDPKIGSAHAVNPQSWNRYSYSLNNPLKNIDPDGKEAILFYRPPDPHMSSTKDYGHVFIYVRNDKTGREGFFDYYFDSGKSAVHRGVPASRIANHAAMIIESTPEAEDRMLDKMDALTKKDPQFNAGQGGWLNSLWNALTGKVNDCVTTTEQILGAGGIHDSSTTPTGLWDDMYAEFSNDSDLDTDFGSQGQWAPQAGRTYGDNLEFHSAITGKTDAQEEGERQCHLGNPAACN